MRDRNYKNLWNHCKLIISTTLAFGQFPNLNIISTIRKFTEEMGRRRHHKPERARTQIAGPDPMWTTCPNCDEEILTTTEASVSIFQMLVSGCLCVFCYCCWWFPFCMDDWKDVLHTCPNCNYAIGKYKKLWWNAKTNQQKKPRMIY